MTIGEKILKYRKQAGLSQEELADKMNVTRQSISLWETDQTTPSLESLIMLAEIFAVSLDGLCGTQPSKATEPAQTESSEAAGRLACAQTQYTVELFKHVNRLTAKKFYALCIIAEIISVFTGIGIIVSDANNAYLAIPVFCIFLFAALIIRVSLLIKKRTAEFFRLRPNCVAKIGFFQDYFDLEVTSDNTDSKSTIRYSDVKKVVNGQRCILIYYGDTVIPIEKNVPDADYDLMLKLLNVPKADGSAPQNGKIKTLLLVTFILSLLSIVMALITVALCVQFSPLPEFYFTFPEYMWMMLLFIPLPLASAVLGIVFLVKKYKCKKNIIAGFIMCVVLAIYGSFPFILDNYTSHDFKYVKELERIVSIDLPDSGYVSVSRAKKADSTTKAEAMIKFDDADEICRTVSTDVRFSDNASDIPSNILSEYYVVVTLDYDYFMLIDVTGNDGENGQNGQHRYVYIAYNIEKNILFVLDFVK